MQKLILMVALILFVPFPAFSMDIGMNLGSAATELTIRRLNNHGGHRYAVFSSIGGFNSGDEIFISEYYDFWLVEDVVLSFELPQEGYTAIDGPLSSGRTPLRRSIAVNKLAFPVLSWKARFISEKQEAQVL